MITTGTGNFFWIEPVDSQFHVCETLEQAREEARKYLADLNGGDGWEADEDDICSIICGTITDRVEFTERRPAEEGDGVELFEGSEIWDFTLKPVEKP